MDQIYQKGQNNQNAWGVASAYTRVVAWWVAWWVGVGWLVGWRVGVSGLVGCWVGWV